MITPVTGRSLFQSSYAEYEEQESNKTPLPETQPELLSAEQMLILDGLCVTERNPRLQGKFIELYQF